LEQEGRLYTTQRNRLDNSWEDTKIKILLRAAKLLEKLGICPQNKISTTLRKRYKGLIFKGTFYIVMKDHPEWKQMQYDPFKKHRGSLKGTSEQTTEPLTTQEQEYKKEVESGIEYDERVWGLISHWTDKTLAEQGRIMTATPKGMNWRKRLAEESKDHMLKLAKRMTTNAVSRTLNDLRTLNELGSAFSDILYDEQELRERNKGLTSA